MAKKVFDTAKALAAQRESKHVEFKEKFDHTDAQDLCEVVKDIVAMANSGGGHILFGVKNDGSVSGWDCTLLHGLDSAQLTDKIASYVGEQFSEFDIYEAERRGSRIAVMEVRPVHIPLIFVRPGTYDVGQGKQKTAFAKGTAYFRHGAKSEPGTSQDIRQSVQREIEVIRRSWLGNIRKVVDAPHGHKVMVLPPEVVESEGASATPIRLVDDPEAPADRKIDPNKTHPYRQKEVVEEINRALAGAHEVSPYDIQCVRKVHKIDESKPQFFYRPMFASARYSHAFIDWMVAQYKKNTAFYEETRRTAKA
jgi:Putative DNA-binding domain/EC042_2821-lke REase